MKNYRPVSNLSFISKVTEKIALSQISEHLSRNELYCPLQSAYRPAHSTETALLCVQNNILCSLDKSKGVILVLLDLSAAFDTIDHDILVSRLQSRTGITGTALEWCSSYLTDRQQSIHVNNTSSSSFPLKYGVPQGSVLGPQIFTIYSSIIYEIALKYNISYHSYADDTQLYESFNISSAQDLQRATRKLLACIEDIRRWMHVNKLKLNDEKTEVLIILPSPTV